MMKRGSRYGVHRVLEPEGVLPQPAQRLDNSSDLYDNELLVEVSTLNVDAASFTQIRQEVGDDQEEIARRITSIVEERGKLQNPVTGSGGMLIGTVAEKGSSWQGIEVEVGDRIASLVSLSLTPLRLQEVEEVYLEKDQVRIRGQAVLFESSIFTRLPEDLPPVLSLAVLDVAGAPAQARRLVNKGQRVLIIGAGGKSGLLCLHEARKAVGEEGQVIGMGRSDASCRRIEETGLADTLLQGDATRALEVYQMVREATDNHLVDLTINCVNIPETEMASIMSTRDQGKIYFFSMATSFTRAALGAEGIGRDVEMIIGNGYARGHDEIALAVLRENERIREIFERLFT